MRLELRGVTKRFPGVVANDSVDLAVEYLRRGEAVGMFPEGTISRSFVPRAGKTGAARMAMLGRAALVPVAVWGTQRILTKDRPKNFERKVAIDVHMGPPIAYRPDEDPAAVTARLMEAITGLSDKAQRNYSQEPSSARDAWWLPAHLGGSAPTIEEADARAQRDAETRREKRTME